MQRVADGLAAWGHGRGAVSHLEELDDDRRATADVDVGLYSDGVSGRAFLEPAQARTLVDRLATVAVEQHDADK